MLPLLNSYKKTIKAAGRHGRKSDHAGRADASSAQQSASELIWGIHPVLEILKNRPGRVSEVLIGKQKSSPKLREITRLAKLNAIKVRHADDGGAMPQQQGVLARIMPFATIPMSELIGKIKGAAGSATGGPPILLVLDSIQDPNNLGAIIRSALAAGVLGIITTKDRAAPLSGTVAKVSAGAVAQMDICRVTNLVAALNTLKGEGFWIYGLVKDAAVSVYEADFSSPACLLVGGEEKGIRPLVREQCDFLVSIPMQGAIDSLNASVAAAVVLFEVVRQRRQGKSCPGK